MLGKPAGIVIDGLWSGVSAYEVIECIFVCQKDKADCLIVCLID